MRQTLLLLLALPVLLLACSSDPPVPTPKPTATQPAPTRAVQVQPTSTPRPAPTPVPTPTAQPTPMSIPGVEAIDATYGEPVAFPEDTMLLIERGCTSCDGPAESLVRVWRNKGEVHFEEIFEAPPLPGEDPYITSMAIGPGASEIVVVVCTKEYCGGLGYPRPGAEATFYRSTDLGATWTPVEVSSRFFHVLGFTNRGIIKAHWGERSPSGEQSIAYAVGDHALPRPAHEQTAPFATGDGQLYWRHGTQVFYEDGRIRIDASYAEHLSEVVERDPGHAPIVGWVAPRSLISPPAYYMTTIGADGTHYGLKLPTFLQVAGWLDYRTLVATMDDPTLPIGRLPGLLDWETGVLTVIGDYPEALRGGRNTVRAVVRGPFLQVAIDGDCVHLRDAPSIESTVVDCVATNAHVRDVDGVGGGPGRWVRVQLIDGRVGFIAGEYLFD